MTSDWFKMFGVFFVSFVLLYRHPSDVNATTFIGASALLFPLPGGHEPSIWE